MKRALSIAGLLLAILLTSANTQAETLIITSGQFYTGNYGLPLPGSRFAGPNIDIATSGASFSGPEYYTGQQRTLIGNFGGYDGPSFRPPGLIGGNLITEPFRTTFEGIYLQISTPSFIVPEISGYGLTLTAPFSLVGQLDIFLPGQPLTVPTRYDLVGQGTVFAEFVTVFPNQPLYYRFERATYTFGAVAPGVTVTPTPEPTSMILAGTGLASLIGLARRRRRR